MSKDFEQAYRELAESEIPDLWDRIEAGLENRSTPVQTEGRAAGEATAVKGQSGKRKRLYFGQYKGVVAAAACAVVVIPAIILLSRSGILESGYGNSGGNRVMEGIDTAAAQDDAFELAADEEESCEAAPEEMDAGGVAETTEETEESAEFEEAAKDEKEYSLGNGQNTAAGAAQEMAEEKASGEMADASQMTDAAASLKREDQSADTDADSSQKKQEQIRGELKQESAVSESETGSNGISAEKRVEGTVYAGVVVKVTEVRDDFDREDGSAPGTLYTVAVQQDTAGQFIEGEKLTIDIPAYSSFGLSKDGVFEVDLVYKGNGIYGLEKVSSAD